MMLKVRILFQAGIERVLKNGDLLAVTFSGYVSLLFLRLITLLYGLYRPV